MKAKTKKILIGSGIGLIILVATILVIVGVATHSEPTFTNDRDLRWENLPVEVGCVGYTPSSEGLCDYVPAAVEAFNDRLGFGMFQWVPGVEGQRIRITAGYPADSRVLAGGEAVRSWRGETLFLCDIHLINVEHPEIVHLTLMHELGHCLDLGHDDYESSIMFDSIDLTPAGSFPPRLSDTDRKAIRERYDMD